MPIATAPLIAPYSAPPPVRSLALITSVLGATSNWLVLRFICDALSQGRQLDEANFGGFAGRKRRVVLVSFLRGWEFWRAEARRIGLDLSRLASDRSFAFVDGFSELFAHAPAASSSSSSTTSPGFQTAPAPGRFPQRENGPTPTGRPTAEPQSRRGGSWRKLRWSNQGGLDALEKDIIAAVEDLNSGTTEPTPAEDDVLLVVDQPDFLLAATGPSIGIGQTELSEMIMGLRQHVHSTVVTVASDTPLTHNASSSSLQSTPLETEHAGFAVSLAHQSRMVMQLRELDTGVARDVSGVLRISKGGRWDAILGLESVQSEQTKWEEKEVLYFVQSDGAVRVFGRGE